MKALATLVVLCVLPFAASAQKPVAKKTAAPIEVKNLSPEFLRPAQHALDAITADRISQNVSKPTPAMDRIDQAAAAAKTDSDKGFVDALRQFNDVKMAANLLYGIKHLTAEIEVKTNGLYSNLEEYDKAVDDKVHEDRETAKWDSHASDCSEELSDMLKNQRFTAAPETCKKDNITK